jgi:hypothetical protein
MKTFLKKNLAGLKAWLEKRGENYVRSNLAELQSLPFFHSIYFGTSAQHCPGWKAPGNAFHSDAPIAVVVTRNGTISGVVGFEIIGSTILIRQLQGAPKGDYNGGVRVEEYILHCAEEIAKALKMKVLRIVTAETAIAYRESAPPEDRPSEMAKVHMKKIYGFPKKVGYVLAYFWRLRCLTFYRQLS